MDRQPLVEVKNLVAKYGDHTILNDLNFAIYSGEIFVIAGGSGCGKTTLLRHLIGLDKPYAGDVLIGGKSISYSGGDLYHSILRQIGVLYQSSALFGSMNIVANVSLPLEELTSLPKEAITAIAHNKLKMVGLEDFADYMPAELSGGMQKRAAIARAMALDPQIIFLDEPTSGLDPISSSEIDQLVVNLAQILGITFVIVTHDLVTILNIANRVILLHDGKIAASGKPVELLSNEQAFVKDFFTSRLVNNDGKRQ